jgi:DNA-binding transcriptional ArsR family regulator
MVKYYTDALDAAFFALSDPTRRAVLARLAQGDASVSELAMPFSMTLAALTKHLVLLENADLIVRRKTGRTVMCRLNASALAPASEWMAFYERFWPAQLDALASYLQPDHTTTTEETPCPPAKPKRSASPAGSQRRGKKSSARGQTRRN